MGAAQMNEDFTVAAQSNAYTVLKYVEQLETPCLRCGACVENCPAGLQPVNIMNANKSKDGALLNKLNYAACIECGLCTYVCPSKIEVTEHVRRAKRYMALQNKK
jgi:electron transport complex protein RnfC